MTIEARREDLFWPKVDVQGPHECWEWLAYRRPSGHGQFLRNLRAHRAAWEFCVGPIPEGLHLHHVCENPGCVNPNHLRPISPEDHGRITHPKGLETHCPRGHEYDETNTYINPKGTKVCRICVYASNRRRYRERKAMGLPR